LQHQRVFIKVKKMTEQEKIKQELDVFVLSVKNTATKEELTFMNRIGMNGIFRSFIDVKMANLLYKRGWIEKGHFINSKLVIFYTNSSLYSRLFY
jgi:hypothetical protein